LLPNEEDMMDFCRNLEPPKFSLPMVPACVVNRFFSWISQEKQDSIRILLQRRSGSFNQVSKLAVTSFFTECRQNNLKDEPLITLPQGNEDGV